MLQCRPIRKILNWKWMKPFRPWKIIRKHMLMICSTMSIKNCPNTFKSRKMVIGHRWEGIDMLTSTEKSSASSGKQVNMTMIQAINDALKTVLTEDETTMLLGEDIGKNGGVFRATEGLQEQFGEDRVVDTPLAESGIIGTSLGLSVNGFKPIAE